jgi:hypothetical protein
MKLFSGSGKTKSFLVVGVVWAGIAALLIYLRSLYQDYILPGFSSSLFSFGAQIEVTQLSLVISMGLYLLEYVIQGVLGVVVIWLAYDILTGGGASVAMGFRRVLRRSGAILLGELVFLLPAMLTLLSTAALLSGFSPLGFSFLFMPFSLFGLIGTILLFIASLGLYVYEAAVVVEEKGLIAAFRRSWYYASRNWGNIFWMLIVTGFIAMIPSFALITTGLSFYYPVQYELLSLIIGPLTGILLKVIVAVVYMHLRVLKGVFN